MPLKKEESGFSSQWRNVTAPQHSTNIQYLGPFKVVGDPVNADNTRAVWSCFPLCEAHMHELALHFAMWRESAIIYRSAFTSQQNRGKKSCVLISGLPFIWKVVQTDKMVGVGLTALWKGGPKWRLWWTGRDQRKWQDQKTWGPEAQPFVWRRIKWTKNEEGMSRRWMNLLNTAPVWEAVRHFQDHENAIHSYKVLEWKGDAHIHRKWPVVLPILSWT